MIAPAEILRTLRQDLHFAIRTLRKSPGFTAVALLTLALGIGANSAIFSVVNGVLLKPLPYHQPDRLVYLYSQFPTMGFDEFWISPPEYRDLQERARSFSAIGAWRTGRVNVAGTENPVRVTSAIVSAEFFTALGVAPLLGRPFTAEEDRPNGPGVAVISYGLWRRVFGGDPQLVGSRVQIDGAPTTITGVMPDGFDIENAGVEVWVPGCTKTVYVEPVFQTLVDPCGRVTRVLVREGHYRTIQEPGHFETRHEEVWVPGHYI